MAECPKCGTNSLGKMKGFKMKGRPITWECYDCGYREARGVYE